ncbi:MAG: helix-turn-helix transcriptional regulator [Pseudomonadota bacterium]|nr:helix-turn-helix transcriptional regulator [Pseudomonadota bacterium]
MPRTSMSVAAKRSLAQANTVDTYVGQRIRDKRNERGMSQTEVANAIGVTFQQVQKYERGTNRVGASRLFDLSRILSVPIQYFFAGLNNQSTPIEKEDDNVIHLMKPDTVELVEAYYKVENLQVRRQILSTIRSISFGD